VRISFTARVVRKFIYRIFDWVMLREELEGFGMRVLKAGEGKKLTVFNRIKSEIIFSGNKVMFLLVDMKPGQIVPEHRHPHEQMGICLKGKAEFISGENRVAVEAGMFYWMKPNEPHSVKVKEESTFLDVFSPPREDYLEKAAL
jgi:quercetin dioxygenase-like cupin family protein